MKWNRYTIETTTAAEDYISLMLQELGIQGVEIEDNVPLTKEDVAEMFIDFLPELPPAVLFCRRMQSCPEPGCRLT